MASPTLGTVTAGVTSADATSTVISGHVLDAGSNNYLLVYVSSDNETINSVTWDSGGAAEQALTQIYNNAETVDCVLSVWGFAGLTADTKDITISHDNGRVCYAAISYTVVDQTTPYSNLTTGTGASGTFEATGLTASADTTAIIGVTEKISRTYTPGTGVTEFHADLEEANKNATLTTAYKENTTSIDTSNDDGSGSGTFAAIELNGAGAEYTLTAQVDFDVLFEIDYNDNISSDNEMLNRTTMIVGCGVF